MAEKNKEPRGNPSWLKWMVTLFIAYAIFMNYQERKDHQNDSVLGVVQQKPAENSTSVSADFGTYTLPKGITIGGDVAGVGDEARCGQTATLNYEGTLPDGKAIKGENEKNIPLHVGLPDSAKPWATAVPGMKKGGVRQIKVLSGLYYDEAKRKELGIAESDNLNYKIEVSNITPQSPLDAIPFQATDRIIGNGEVANCGMIADVALRLWGADGTVYYDSRKANADASPITFHIGKSEIFYGLDRGLLGMKKGGQRSLIVPPAFAIASENAQNPLKDVLKKDAVALVEVELLDVRWK